MTPFYNLLVGLGLIAIGFIVWRTQNILKRRSEIAEQASVAFAKGEIALQTIRSPFVTGEELEAINVPDEWRHRREAYKQFGVTLNRIERQAQVFSEVHSIEILCRINLGKKASDALATLWRCRNRVMLSARMLRDAEPIGVDECPEMIAAERQAQINERRRYEADLFDTTDADGLNPLATDTISQRVIAAKGELNQVCKQYLELPPWKEIFRIPERD